MEEQYKGYTIKIESDDTAESPREWDNLGTMVARHRDYKLGDKVIPESFLHDSGEVVYIDTDEDIKEWIKQEYGEVAVIKPLFLLDHSGISMSTSKHSCDPQGWDTSFVGFIFVTRAKVLKEYNVTRINKQLLAKLDGILTSEVNIYDKYLRGDVVGFVVEDANGAHVNSCWGFYEVEDALAEARSAIDFAIEEAQKAKEKKLRAYIINSVPFEYRAL